MRFWKSIKLLLTLKCEQSSRLMSAGLDRELSSIERWAVRLHGISCRECRRLGKQLAFLQEAVRRRREQLEDQSLRQDAKAAIATALQQQGRTDLPPE